MPTPALVIFDMDGTLTVPRLDFDAIRAEIGLPPGPILESVATLPPVERARADAILMRHEAEAAAESVLQPGAERVIAALRAARVPVALMTRNSRISVARLLERHSLRFDRVRTREDGPQKPSPEPVFDLCAAFSVRPGEAWVVGDDRFDVQSGRSAGATTALLPHGSAREAWMTEADHLLGGLAELLTLWGMR